MAIHCVDLPNTILENIFLRTDLKDWIKILPNVCKSWQNTMPLLWANVVSVTYQVKIKQRFIVGHVIGDRKTSKDCWSKISSDLGFRYFTERLSQMRLKSICLDTCWDCLNQDSILPIGRKFKNVQKLTLILSYRSKMWLCETMVEVFKNLADLREICIVYQVIPDFVRDHVTQQVDLLMNWAISICKTLKIVNVTSSHSPNIGVWRSLESLSHLEEFRWKGCSVATAEYLKQIFAVLARCTSNKLQKIGLVCDFDSPLEDHFCKRVITELAKKPIRDFLLGLRFVDYRADIDQPLDKPDKIVYGLVDFKDLKMLSLERVNFATSSFRAVLPRLAVTLTYLRLDAFEHLSDDFFGVFTLGMPRLETLILGTRLMPSVNHSIISVERFVEFLCKCNELKKLQLEFQLFELEYANFLTLLHGRLHVCQNATVDPPLNIFVNRCDETVVNRVKSKNLCGLKILFNQDVAKCRIVKCCKKTSARK